ncbi:MAG: MarR family transcriptional regulator, organic hydroperoxide resistance regulator [Acidimicrobiaceae bacterium]|nr:MarR family transcriptional regulator, organic hydroperoxide resistance regulator [Acidimicrobiaceae bacterium]
MEPPGHEAWRLMAEMMLSHDSMDRLHNACAAADVTPPLLKALMSLGPGQAWPMSVLAKGWRCDASWVTGIVDGLEERGYVQRRTLETDRRVKLVEITEGGEAARAKALDVLFDPPPSINTLSAKDQLALRNIMRKVRVAEPRGVC